MWVFFILQYFCGGVVGVEGYFFRYQIRLIQKQDKFRCGLRYINQLVLREDVQVSLLFVGEVSFFEDFFYLDIEQGMFQLFI